MALPASPTRPPPEETNGSESSWTPDEALRALAAGPWSPSRIYVAERCLTLLRARYGPGAVKAPPTPAQALGLAVHAALERWVRGRLWEQPDQVAGLLAEVAAGQEGLDLEGQQRLAELVRIAIDRMSDGSEVPLDGTALVEQSVAVARDWFACSWSAAWMRGRVDVLWLPPEDQRQDTPARIWDWKSGRLPGDEDQAQYYAAMLLSSVPGLEAVVARTVAVEQWIVRERTYRWQDVQHVVSYVEGIARRVADAQWAYPEPGPHCGWCEVAMRCPAVRALRQRGISAVLASRHEAETAARLKPLLDGASNALDTALRAWVEANGPLDMDGRRLMSWPTEPRLKLDGRTVARALTQAVGAEVAWRALSTTKSAVEAACREAGIDPAPILATGAPTPATRFEWRKAKTTEGEGV